ncbi:MAG: radical SAM protein [Patescibacteria group bacterium]|jgi:radical SAM superfamily enzyme YgiQ (UPF0313 family)
MAQVVLIQASMGFYGDEGIVADQTSNPPMGLLYIAAYLEKYGVSVRLIDPFPEQLNLADILKEIELEKPLVIGISAMTPGIPTAYKMAQAIRGRFGPRPFIGVGGIHTSVDPGFIDRYPIFDFEVVGEGEVTFYEVLQTVLAGKIPQKKYFGKIIENLDDLPFPARHLLRGRYFCPHDETEADDPEVTIIASRGCPFHCIFCSKPGFRDRYRYRSAKNIVDEMERDYKLCNGKFNFVDDTIGANQQRAIEFCEEIMSRKLKVQFAVQMRATDASDVFFKKLAASGCREIFFGVESGSNRVRNEIIEKRVPEEKLFEAVKLCRRYGMQSNFYLMLGFPTETKKDLEDTVNIGVRTKVDFIGLHVTQIIPGSRLYDLAIKEGKMSNDLLDQYIRGELGNNFFEVFPKYIPDGLTIKDLEAARTLAYRKFFINPGWWYRRIRSYFKHPDRLVKDWKQFRLGIYVLIHGHTKSAAS